MSTLGFGDITFTLSGSTHVLPIKKWLGEQLANRVNTTHAQSHVIGSFKDLSTVIGLEGDI